MLFVEPSADVALIQSGEPFRHLYFVQYGMIVPWQYPYSELSSPFLIGDHEFMMGAERWVASYSAATQTIVVAIPVATMRLAVERIPQIHAKMYLVLLRRMARYYWISLATNGSPAPRVAAALMSRLALNGEDHGCEREVNFAAARHSSALQSCRARPSRAASQHSPPKNSSASGTTTAKDSQGWFMSQTLTD